MLSLCNIHGRLRHLGTRTWMRNSYLFLSYSFDYADYNKASFPTNIKASKKTAKKKVNFPRGGRYILQDDKSAKKIVRKLKTAIDFSNPDITFVECNPGPALLTKSLLMRSSVQVITLSYLKKTNQELKTLQNSQYFQQRLHTETGNISDIRQILKRTGHLSDQPGHPPEWNSECPFKIIGTTFPLSAFPQYLSLLAFDLEARNHIYSLGRMESYMFVPSTEIQIIGKKSSGGEIFERGSLRSSLYKIFFDVDVLFKLPPDAFGVKPKENSTADQRVFFIRVVPKLHLYEDVCEKGSISALICLLKDLRKRRGKPLYSSLEVLCPGISERLDAEGIPVNQDVSSLSVAQILFIFKVLLNSPASWIINHPESQSL